MITDKEIENALENEYDGWDKFLIVQELLTLKASHDKLLVACKKGLAMAEKLADGVITTPRYDEGIELLKQALTEAKKL